MNPFSNMAGAHRLRLDVHRILQMTAAAATLAAPCVRGEWPVDIQVQHRPGTYWWTPGSAWDEESIDWNLEHLRDAGIGTAHIIPIYGANGYEDREIPYLSERWSRMLQYVLARADALGLQIDMTTGTGWCFGGPDVPPSLADQVVAYDPATGVRTRPGMRVKRAAPGGAGPMLDPYSSEAMARYLEPFTEALADAPARPRAQYHDSFEYNGNWTARLPEAFRSRRGYDLAEQYPVLFAEESDASGRVKYDYRRTLAELHRDQIAQWSDWARRYGMRTRNQAHGAPANLLDVYAAADIPETEMFGSPSFPIPGFRYEERWCRAADSDPRVAMMASSAAHVTKPPGAQLVSSESCTWMREHWHGTPGQIKLEMDLFFLAGINHVFYHGSCYSPKDAPWPGFYFYASTKADWRNAIWHDLRYVNDYIARCQSILQRGQHDNDVLVYWPIHDLWMRPRGLHQPLKVHDPDWMRGERIGSVSEQLLQEGFAFDFVSDRMLADARYEDGVIRMPGGDYRALVIPACTYMPATTLSRIADLSVGHAAVIFEDAIPSDVPGAHDVDRRRAALAEAAARLHRARVTPNVASALRQAVQIRREPIVDRGLRFVRRSIDGRTWYFIANHTASACRDWVRLSAPFASVVRHDPMTARSAALPVRRPYGRAEVYLEMEPGEALLLETRAIEAEEPYWIPMESAGDPLPLEGSWRITFIEGGPGLPEPYEADSLASWTEAPDEAAQAFAGTARYALDFDLPAQRAADDWLLDLGDVRESARVRINDREVAALVALPFRTRVGGFLRPGRNTIEIDVTNTSANRIRSLDRSGATWRIMKDADIVTPNYTEFDASGWPLQPAGLLGPVTLTPLRSWEL